MLRFGNDRIPQTRPPFGTRGRSVWMLLLMLGAVIALMRQVQQPTTADLLGRLFNSSSAEDRSEKSPQPAAKPSSDDRGRNSGSPSVRKPESGGPWAAVKDNATFIPAERTAWALLWDEVRRTPSTNLERQAIGTATYAQLVNQPNLYRGLPVRVRGRVLRESVKRAPENLLGITAYHQLVLAPIGGGDWPVMIYCLNLPKGFPRGEGLKVDLTVVGLFFKNWSYPYEGGMGLAPVIVTNAIDWRLPIAPSMPAAAPPNAASVWMGGAAALLAAVGFTRLALRRTRRPAKAETESPNFARLEQ